MNRLQSELQRLYGLAAAGTDDPGGRTRAAVMELTGEGAWDGLSAIWRGVQSDLALPAPAIAVSGTDGMQLWFSLEVDVSFSRAGDLLDALRARYLPGIAARRLKFHPRDDGGGTPLPSVPAQSTATGNWSAFVAPDLAPIFADTPWLDLPPGIDGQADLLARLQSIKPVALDAALQVLRPAGTHCAAPEASHAALAAPVGGLDPRQFLQHVLNDETVALALRIEAAKALLANP